MITTDAVSAWCLVNGAWAEREDPVMAVCDPSGGDVHAAMTNLGYEAWCHVGVGDPSVPVSLAVYSREAPPMQFLLQLEGNAGNVVEHVFAETLPDAMELLARWAPLTSLGGREGPYERGRGQDGTRRPEDASGRPGDDSALSETASGRLGEDPGRPSGPGDDRPVHPRHAVTPGLPVPVDLGVPPAG